MTTAQRRRRARGRHLGVAAASLMVASLGVTGAPTPSALAQVGTPTPEPPVAFAEAPIGAAAVAGVTGGAGGRVRVVSQLGGDGPGSLRAAAETPGPAIVLFAVSGKIELRKTIAVASNLTIDGRGADVTVVGKGLVIDGGSNIILRNLRVRDSPESDSNDDAIAVAGGAKGVWIDHMDLTGFKDGLIDVTQGATGVTLSWNKLADHGKTMLLGSNVQEGTPDLVDITVHHNLYEGTGERSPMVRQARVHVFNNVLQSWGYAADSGYGMRSDCGGIVLVEANIFRPSENPRAVTTRGEKCDPTRQPALRLQANDLGGADAEDARSASVPNLAGDVVPDPVGAALLAKVQSGAGWQQVANPVPLPAPEEKPGPADPAGPDPPSDSPGSSSNGRALALVGGALAVGVGLGVVITGQARKRTGRHRR